MPLSHYPVSLRDDCFSAAASPRGHTLVFPSLRQAINARQQFYNFRKALWLDTIRPPNFADHTLLDIVEHLSFSIHEGFVYTTLTIKLKRPRFAQGDSP
jgi:hypothetical protein